MTWKRAVSFLWKKLFKRIKEIQEKYTSKLLIVTGLRTKPRYVVGLHKRRFGA